MKNKTKDQIEILRENALIVSRTLGELAKHVKPGVSTLLLDKIAEEFIRDNGAIPGFLGFGGFPNTLCTSVNSAVVHGIPSGYILKDGDIVSIDCGTIYKGFYGDSAFTFAVGEISESTANLLKVTRESLFLGIEQTRLGNTIGDISFAVQDHVEQNGFSVVRDLVGHGIGANMHEKPEVPNYGKKRKGSKLASGLVLCIEPMVNEGSRFVITEKDGWTVSTADKKLSAHFELTVAVTDGEPDILSTFEFIDQSLKKN